MCLDCVLRCLSCALRDLFFLKILIDVLCFFSIFFALFFIFMVFSIFFAFFFYGFLNCLILYFFTVC